LECGFDVWAEAQTYLRGKSKGSGTAQRQRKKQIPPLRCGMTNKKAMAKNAGGSITVNDGLVFRVLKYNYAHRNKRSRCAFQVTAPDLLPLCTTMQIVSPKSCWSDPMRLSALFSSLSLCALAIALGGCSAGVVAPPSTIAPSGHVVLRGNVHGGQQPIIGASMQLWAAGTTDASGNVTPPSLLLQNPVFTDSSGSFSITNDYHCPSANTQVYMIGRGGNPGDGSNNPQIVMMSLLGACGSLTPSTYIFINEETTVIAAEMVAGGETGSFDANDNITGTTLDNGASLATSFSEALEYVNPTTGAVPGPAAPQGENDFIALINSLADILSSCVNSRGGVAGDSSLCGMLFTQTTFPGGLDSKQGTIVQPGPTPTDTLQAIVDLIVYTVPASRVPSANYGGNLFTLIPAAPPYLPDLPAAPATWALFPAGVTMFAATSSGDGVVHIPFSTQGSGAFAVGAQVLNTTSPTLTLSTSDLAGTPVFATICQTNPNNGQCLTAPAASVSVASSGGPNYVFSVFVTASAPIVSTPFYVNLSDSNGNPLGSTAVMLTTN
jgi:hypothetical protein